MVGMIQAFRRWLLRHALRITKWIGKQHAPYTHKRIKLKHYLSVRDRLLPGDVLMSRTDGELTNVFIPGFWSHGAVYVGNGEVVEAIGEGVSDPPVPLLYWMMTKDYVRVCRPRFATEAQMDLAAKWCRQQAGKPYDYDFSAGNEAWYCFELSYGAYQYAMNEASPWELRTNTLGELTVVGDDFDRAEDKWLLFWDSRGVP